MREFVDLNIKATGKNLLEMIEKSKKLGFKFVGVDVSLLKNIDSGIDVVSRINLTPKNVNELSRDLKRYRRLVEIISVKCNSINISRKAAKDHRVDIISFSEHNNGKRRVWLDRQEANLASNSNVFYELVFKDLQCKSGLAASKVIYNWRREVANAHKYDVPVLISSGASSTLELREPRALASIMCLLDLDEEEALEMVSNTPLKLIERNRGKLDERFISPGVRVL